MIKVLFAARPDRWPSYEIPLKTAFAEAGLAVDLRREFAPEDVDYIIYAPNGEVQDFAPYVRCKAVLSLWAGVESIVGNASLTQPLARMVDTGLTQGMVEWVCGHVLRHHLGMDRHLLGQDGLWRADVPPLAPERRVSLLGLGALGMACGQALAGLGFPVTGWSRREKHLEGITCLYAEAGLKRALAGADILVLLLPGTSATDRILNAETLAALPRGAVILNPGRGQLIDDDALLSALDSGQVAHATLDVFRTEPLPPAHRFWSHPGVTVTPHIASETRPDSASRVIAQNILRGETGQGLLHLVDRKSGY